MYFSAQEMLAQLEGTDERICDGFYFATVLKYLKRLMAHPERLDTPPEEVVHDIE